MPVLLAVGRGENAVRKLAIFSFAFAAAAAAYVYLLPSRYALPAAGAAALCALGLLLRRTPAAKRARIALFALACGLLWSCGYEALKLKPLQAYCGEDTELTVTVCAYPVAGGSGEYVEAETNGTGVRLYFRQAPELRPGDTVRLRASVRAASDGKDENLYFASRDIRLIASQRGEPEITRPEKTPLRFLPTLAAYRVRQRITALFSEDTEAFVRALLTGDRSGLSYETKNQMSVVGISHVVAVSGLHVSLIVGFVQLLCLRRRRLASAVSIAAMLLFAAMLGFPASVVRAVVMNSMLLLAPLVHRENDTPTALGFALLLLLAVNPWAAADVSLQLSFGATAGIVLWARPLQRWQERRFLSDRFCRKHRFLTRLARGVFSIQAMSLSAAAFTTPLVAYYFGTVSLIAPVTNLLLLTLIGWIFTASCAGVLASFLWLPLGKIAARCLDWPVRAVLAVIRALSKIPFAAVYTQSEYVCLWLAALYALLAVFLIGRFRCKRVFCAAVAASLVCAVAFSMLPEQAQLVYTVLDVGQGQCILLQAGGVTAVVDCGGSYAEDAGEQLARRLLMQGKTQIDFLVLTHYDEDHAGGAEQLLSRMEVGSLFAPDLKDKNGLRERVLTAAQRAGTSVNLVTADVTAEFPGGTLQIFAPVQRGTDNEGISALMSVQEYDILITGDMGMQSEQLLALRHGLHDIEVLVAGHHGSKGSTGSALLQAIRPELVLISVGENSYGHPSPEVLQRIEDAGALVLRTDELGDIEIKR